MDGPPSADGFEIGVWMIIGWYARALALTRSRQDMERLCFA